MLIVLLFLLGPALFAAPQPRPEKELILTITAPELKGGVISEITWDGDTLMLQGVFAEPTGELKAQYFVVPADGTKLEHRKEQTDSSLEYWRRKSRSIARSTTGSSSMVQMTGFAMQTALLYFPSVIFSINFAKSS